MDANTLLAGGMQESYQGLHAVVSYRPYVWSLWKQYADAVIAPRLSNTCIDF